MSNDPQKIIYSMLGVSKKYNNKTVIKDISLSYFYGAKIGVLGLNGSGKSTLLRIIAGMDKDFDGEIQITPGYTVGYLPQEPLVDETKTVREVVEEAVSEVTDLLKEFDEINEKFAEEMSDDDMDKLMTRQGDVQEKLDLLNAWDLDSRLDMAMDALRCPPPDSPVNVLSGGEKRRVALCRLLLQKPDILLLDEPTNHLDAETISWLERHLQQYEGTIIAITHDRYFLDNVAGWILELDRGEGIPWKGNYSSWLDQKQKRLAIEQKQDKKRQQALKHELEWIGKTPQGRQAKSKARISSFESLSSNDERNRAKDAQIYIPPGPRLGELVIKADNLTKAYGDKLLMDNLNFELPRGGIVGVIGPNGAGKTTLFRMITGEEQPDSGSLTVGETVELGYVDQTRDDLDDNKTIWETLSGGNEIIKLGDSQINSRAYCARFSFTGPDQQQKLSNLSGGQRNRVHLANMLKQQMNVLLLDEPTNDLDVNTIRALEEAVTSFVGCAVVVSHDRWFLDRIATHILAFEGDSEIVFYPGNYSDYEADYKRRKGHDADQPHRIKYRKLTR
ncbi:putative ABC transporter ATP-binding protein [Poriferisphaera corsica]|uniref:Energy-dependent translational throttle protein EttA n=1 Tax=Poriferisphaera corsica TaxID=2528020 RepID=A0A517YT70_9BACT|nr:energy-dependent translational throttle protein EttA [Poriferisphaera corsica]QDU33435.1 putative ABC transporter ATP-binding protein [Poriferisphaera corsica]